METTEQSESWRVVLFTDFAPNVAIFDRYLAERGHRLVGLVTSPKRGPEYINVVSAARPDIDVIVSNHPKRWARMVAPLRPDLLISFGFPWRIPADVIALPRLGTVNEHPSPLPKYRGTHTPRWMFRHRERTWGFTVHRMTSGFDDGAILSEVLFEVGDDDDIASIFQESVDRHDELWDRALERIAAGDPGHPQDESQATYFAKIQDEAAWRTLDWTLAAREVHNVVRSCSGAGGERGAHATIDGVPMRVLKTRLIADAPARNGTSPGTVVRDGATLRVQCGDHVIEVVEHQPM